MARAFSESALSGVLFVVSAPVARPVLGLDVAITGAGDRSPGFAPDRPEAALETKYRYLPSYGRYRFAEADCDAGIKVAAENALEVNTFATESQDLDAVLKEVQTVPGISKLTRTISTARQRNEQVA